MTYIQRVLKRIGLVSGPTQTMTYIIRNYNNIAYQPLSISSGGGHVAAYAVHYTVSNYTDGGTGLQNIFRADNSSCTAQYCNPSFDAQVWGSSAMLGTDTYANPSFINTRDLLANRLGVPNCSGFTNQTCAWDGTPTRAR